MTAKKKNSSTFSIILFIILLLICALVCFFNFRAHLEVKTPESSPTPAPSFTQPVAKTPEPTVPVTMPSEATPTLATPLPQTELRYTPSSYQAVTDIIALYRSKNEAAADEINALLDSIAAEDTSLAAFWTDLIAYWRYVNTEIELNYDILPDGLPDDNSLCIVVLGFRLENDGSMSPELVRRCEVALASANKYPNAFIALTGGGTAVSSSATEAEVMAAWLEAHGIDKSRIIIENNSQTTGENAQFTVRILRDDYPQVQQLAIVSSSYHVPEGSLVFYLQSLLTAYEEGLTKLNIISNACADLGPSNYCDVNSQGRYIWQLTNPSY